MKNLMIPPTADLFHEPASKWSIQTHHGVVIQPHVEQGIMTLDITGASGANWHGELIYAPIHVQEGDTYEIKFTARARHPFMFSVWLGQLYAPFESLVEEDSHFGQSNMTNQWQTFTHTWNVVKDEDYARLDFVLGQIDNQIQFKSIGINQLHAVTSH